MADMVFLRSPQGDEIKEVEATTATLSPLMSTGWHQVPAPTVQKPVVLAEEEKQHG